MIPGEPVGASIRRHAEEGGAAFPPIASRASARWSTRRRAS